MDPSYEVSNGRHKPISLAVEVVVAPAFENNQSRASNSALYHSSAHWCDEITATDGDKGRKVDSVELIPDIPMRHRPSRATSEVNPPHQRSPNRVVGISARQHEFDGRNCKVRYMQAPELLHRLLVTPSSRPTSGFAGFDSIPVSFRESRNESDFFVDQLLDAGVTTADDQAPKPALVAEGSLKG